MTSESWFAIDSDDSPLRNRKITTVVLGEVVAGRDPATEKHARRSGVTVAELCRRYLADAEAGRLLLRSGQPKKPRTLLNDRIRITNHVVPSLGALPIDAVTKQDVEKMMHTIAAGATKSRGGRGVARRTVTMFGAICTYAIERGLRLRADNPVSRLRKFAEGRRERRLSEEEYAALGTALRSAEATIWPSAGACLHFLALSGWRSAEARGLRWQDVDLVRRTGVLADSKSGRSMRPLSHLACELLRKQPRLVVNDSGLVFPPSHGGGLLALTHVIRRLMPPGITPHVLRHSFASLAADLGYAESTIAQLIGHKGHSMTSRYLHAADAVLLAAADAVAGETARRMGDIAGDATVVQLRAVSTS
jgi:integrase